MKYFISIFVFLSVTYYCNAQGKYNIKDYSHHPIWIEMIKDTSANFFETEKAFKTYFETHEAPGGEHDIIGEYATRNKRLSSREKRKLQQENQMRIEVKKYRHWHDVMLPYVQPDGHILTPSEKINSYNKIKNN